MLRKNKARKDIYFILILFIISITMLFTVCSSESMADSINSSRHLIVSMQSNIEKHQEFNVQAVDLSEIEKIRRRNNRSQPKQNTTQTDQNIIEWEGYEIKLW